MLNEYLDGTLAPYLEELLFAELSRNEELRSTLRAHRSLQQAARYDARRIQAPSYYRDALIQRLGLSTSNSAAMSNVGFNTVTSSLGHEVAASTASAVSPAPTPLRSTPRRPLSLLLGTAFLLGLFSYHVGSKALDGVQSNNAELLSTLNLRRSTEKMTGAQSDASRSSATNLNTTRDNDSRHLAEFSGTEAGSPTGKTLYSSQAHPVYSVRQTQHSTSMQSIKDKSQSLGLKTESAHESTRDVQGMDNTRSAHSVLPFETIGMVDLQHNSALNGNGHGTVAASLQKTVVPSAAIAPFYLDSPYSVQMRSGLSTVGQANSGRIFDNAALRVLIEVDERFQVGVECANDLYSIARTVRVAGSDQVINSKEARLSVSALLHANVLSLSDIGWEGFAECAAGATALADIVGSAGLGIQWSPEGPLSLQCSLHYTVLNYRSSTERLNAGSLALHYGLGIHF